MSESNLEMTEAINGNVKQTNAIANGGLKVLGAASGLEMSITVNQTTAVIQDIAAGGTGGGGGSASIDLSFVTATAADILSGKVGADVNGNPVNGAIKTVTASLSGNVVTVPAGFIAKDQTLTVPKAGAETVSGNEVTIPVGYIDNQRTITVGTAKGAETFTPGTADKTIAAGTYLSGVQTIKGDANLKAENIAEGVSIFGIAGAFKGGGGAEFFKCASVDIGKSYIIVSGAGTPECNGTYVQKDGSTNVYKNTKNKYELTINNTSGSYYDTEVVMTIGYYDEDYMMEFNMYNRIWLASANALVWEINGGALPFPEASEIYPTTGQPVWSGYKAVLNNGEYAFEETETTGLTYSMITPKVGKVYTADALAEAKLWTGAGNMPAGVPTDQLLAWFPLTVNANDAFGGHNDAVIKGNVDFSEGYATGWSTSNYIQLPGSILATGQNEWTIGFLIQKSERGFCHDLAEVNGSNQGVAFHDQGGWYHIQYQNSEWTAVNEQPFNNWLLMIVTNSPSSGYMRVYTNGNEARNTSSKGISINKPVTIGVLNSNGTIESATASTTKMKHVFFYGKALSSTEISTMYQAMQNAGEME